MQEVFLFLLGFLIGGFFGITIMCMMQMCKEWQLYVNSHLYNAYYMVK